MDVYSTRKTIRLKNYDYSQPGYYYITVCTYQRQCLLANVKNVRDKESSSQVIELTVIGKSAQEHLTRFNEFYPNVKLDSYVIMPNHIHMIIAIDNGLPNSSAPSIPLILHAFKNQVAKKYGSPLWQRSYHEIIIRSEQELSDTRTYILNNPLKWILDKYYMK